MTKSCTNLMTLPLTAAELSLQIITLMGCDGAWRTTDDLLWVTAGRVSREMLIEVLFGLHDKGKLSYKRSLGWRIASR